MAHKTEASGEYPWPPEVASIIYDYYFDAPKILGAENELFALCVDGTLHVSPNFNWLGRYTNIESIASNELDPGHVGITLSTQVLIKGSGEVFTRRYDRTGIDLGQGGIRFVTVGYYAVINEHQASIREAFKNATGMG